MDIDEKEREKHISMMEVEDEELGREVSVEEKKAAIRAAKRAYGHDWKKMLFGAAKSLKVNRETLQTLHGMGFGGSSLKRYNDPRMFSRKRGVFEE